MLKKYRRIDDSKGNRKSIFEMIDYIEQNCEEIYENRKLKNVIVKEKREPDMRKHWFTLETRLQLLESQLGKTRENTPEYKELLEEIITTICESNSLDPNDNKDRIKAFNNINLKKYKDELKDPKDKDNQIIFTADKWIKKVSLKDNVINYNLTHVRSSDSEPDSVLHAFGQQKVNRLPKSPSDELIMGGEMDGHK